MKRRGKKGLRAVVFCVAMFAAAVSGCGETKPGAQAAPETVRGVAVESVGLQKVPDEIEAPGTVISATTAEVSARTMGTVVAVRVREGDVVRAGQVLAELDDRELKAHQAAAQAAQSEAAAAREAAERGVAAAEAQAEVAKKTYDRFVFLRDQKSVSAQEFDEAAAKHRAAEAQLAAARAGLQRVEAMQARMNSEASAARTVAGYTRVTAPFSGIVVRRIVDPGTMAAPGMPLLVLENAEHYQMEATLDAARTAGVPRGSKARVMLDGMAGRTWEGTVAEVEAGADPTTQTVRVKVNLPRDPAFRSGLFGRAYFARGEREILAAPESAIIERGQLRGVYVVDGEGVVRLRIVTLGRAATDGQKKRMEILSGLTAGERIVVAPGGRELDGKKVEAGK